MIAKLEKELETPEGSQEHLDNFYEQFGRAEALGYQPQNIKEEENYQYEYSTDWNKEEGG